MLSLVIQSISCKNAPGIISFALEDKLINIGQCVEAGNNSDATPFEVYVSFLISFSDNLIISTFCPFHNNYDVH